MKKVKVFQLQQKRFDSEGNVIPKNERKNKIVCIGTVIVPKNKKKILLKKLFGISLIGLVGGTTSLILI